MEYGAIDLHTKESQIRIVTSDGRVVLDQRIATRRDRFTGLFGDRPAMRILLETGTESEWVAQHLESLGHEVVVADPNYSPMYGERTRRIKTDKRDVAALAEAIADAARLGLDIGGADVLERYQRWRRFDTMTMGVATDGLNRLFSNSSDVLRLMRDLGLGVVERIPALKRVFIREAAGFTGDVPKLLKGETL